ncbi:MAG: hypothetical protein RL398_36 [Planctomycetota bacterium]
MGIARAALSGLLLLGLTSCTAVPEWGSDLGAVMRAAKSQGADAVVFLRRDGAPESDRTVPQLADARVAAALAAGGFVAACVDSAEHERLVPEWVGGRDGFGFAIVDSAARPWAARPGPLDADELAAWLRFCAAHRDELRRLLAACESSPADPTANHALGRLALQLGHRRLAEEALSAAALGGVMDARHRLAKLYALDGDLTKARRWLAGAAATPAMRLTEGYVLWKERRYDEAAAALEAALAGRQLGDERQWAVLYLGKVWHDLRQDDRAAALLDVLVGEGTGSLPEASAAHTLRHLRGEPHDD